MASEVDPLLPRNEPSPEIFGDGFSRKKGSQEISYDEPQTNDQAEPGETLENSTTRTALSSIISIFTVVVLIAFLSTLYYSDESPRQPKPLPAPARTILERANRILDDTPLIDGHNDLAILIRGFYHNKIHTSSFLDKFEHGGMEANVDIPRLRKGKVGGAFWSAFVACPDDASNNFSDSNYATATSSTLQQIDLIRRLQSYYPYDYSPATANLSTAMTAFHSNHTMISPISIEGLHQIPPSAPFSTLRLYRQLGVRAATLTWNCHNAFADAALISDKGKTVIATPKRSSGLTKLGRRVLHEMNRIGMLIDLSHTAYQTQLSVLSGDTSLSPVIFSHSSAYTLCPHPRNVRDDVLDLVKSTNSLVMINFSPGFISCVPPEDASDPKALPTFVPANNTLHQVARHVVYVGQKIGYDHVGLGSDFDGMGDQAPRGLDGVDKFPDLVAALLEMGVGDDDVRKVVGGNLLRVWRAADEVAAKMMGDGVLEEEDDVKGWMDMSLEQIAKVGVGVYADLLG